MGEYKQEQRTCRESTQSWIEGCRERPSLHLQPRHSLVITPADQRLLT
jgi:hypothetical protein